MNIDLNKYFTSFQKNTWKNISQEMSINSVLDVIKSDSLKRLISELREALNNKNEEFYKQNKLKLPAVTFCGTFDSRRTSDNLKKYNNLIVIDIDKLSLKEMNKVQEDLFNDIYVFSYWKSPSNKGFKGLIHLKYSNEIKREDIVSHHKYAFQKLFDYFLDKYKIDLDKSGSDITRLCFLSHDKKLVLKNKITSFHIDNSKIELTKPSKSKKTKNLIFSNNKDTLYSSDNRNNQYDRKLMSSLIRFLNNKNTTITENYENWYKTAMAISNTFTYDIGLKYFIKISKRDTKKFNEIECTDFLTNCYENRNGEINLASIIYLANQKGFKTKYQKNGVPKVKE